MIINTKKMIDFFDFSLFQSITITYEAQGCGHWHDTNSSAHMSTCLYYFYPIFGLHRILTCLDLHSLLALSYWQYMEASTLALAILHCVRITTLIRLHAVGSDFVLYFNFNRMISLPFQRPKVIISNEEKTMFAIESLH